ncbi:MAG TPA: precorrin-6A reductase [Firmicutes bacterium]|jgi:precorrin-6A/cobalt-precorrin-6A reductase|nr:precorrin-6A reductase [Bacillota bacterium]
MNSKKEGWTGVRSIILIAGTVDARLIIEKLISKPVSLHATVTTDLGAEYLSRYPQLIIHQGALDYRGMRDLFRLVQPVLVIDASHPFAREVSCNAMAACRDAQIRYLRFEREETFLAGADITWVSDFEEAAAKTDAIAGNALLTIGSNHLESFARRVENYRERLFIRVLPVKTVLEKCERLGFAAARIIAMQGPFSLEMNLAHMGHCKAGLLVTKESGVAGGNREKLAAAQKLKIPVMMVRRPQLDYGWIVQSVESIVKAVKEILN